jgi:hypothetical protein
VNIPVKDAVYLQEAHDLAPLFPQRLREKQNNLRIKPGFEQPNFNRGWERLTRKNGYFYYRKIKPIPAYVNPTFPGSAFYVEKGGLCSKLPSG